MACFAVVIPNLNQSLFLRDALESLKHQSVDCQLALMDGGSTDGFEPVAKKYSDIITVLRSGPDGGQAAAIRNGMSAIKGDIACWLNADDYFSPGALDAVAAFFKDHPDVDVVYGDAVHVKPDGAFLSYFPAIEDFDARRLPRSCYICQPACFVRRAAYDASGGVDIDLKYTMDWDLWCRLSQNGAKFHYMHMLLAAVRCYPQTKTLSGDRRRYQEIWRIGKKYGNRMIPLPWAGFYLYDLSFKKEKATGGQKIVRWGLQRLRQFKKKINPGPTDLLYGFHRWEGIVERECIIEIPWYYKENIKGVRIRVADKSKGFRVRVNHMSPVEIYPENSCLSIALPPNPGDCCRLKIENMGIGTWELIDFSIIER